MTYSCGDFMKNNATKLSVTVPEDLANFINYYSSIHDSMTRSAVIVKALELLKNQELANAYMDANSEIDYDFENSSGDGL